MTFLVMNNQVLGKGIRRWITFLLYIVSLMYICSDFFIFVVFVCVCVCVCVRLLTIKRPLTVCSADCCGENC